MAVFMTPIASKTTPGGTQFVQFTNIPQGYKDLHLEFTYKDTQTSTGSYAVVFINSTTANNGLYSGTYVFTSVTDYGAQVVSTRGTSENSFFVTRLPTSGTSWSANVFSLTRLYFPNYSGSSFKTMFMDVSAANTTNSAYSTNAGGCLLRTTSAITSILIYSPVPNQNAGCRYSLYGVLT